MGCLRRTQIIKKTTLTNPIHMMSMGEPVAIGDVAQNGAQVPILDEDEVAHFHRPI